MPYLNVRLSMDNSLDVAENVKSILMKHTTETLGKNAEVTSIEIDFISPNLWFVSGAPAGEQGVIVFYLDVKVTEGTNTKDEKATYIDKVFSDIQSRLGPISDASYIVVHDVSADSWGFQGRTQEYRFVAGRSL